MAMTQVGPVKIKVTKEPHPPKLQVSSIRDITKVKRRIEPRKELSNELLKEFVNTINAACDSGTLPYQNYRLNQEGSPNQVYAHYMCDKLDPVYLDVAKKISLKEKTSFEDALKGLAIRLTDKRKAGLAFILTNDCKSFWLRPKGNYTDPDGEIMTYREHILYHDREDKAQFNAEEKKIIAKLRKLIAPGKEDALLRELRKA